MSDLFITYKEEVKKELLFLYAKSCILKEYIHILPILSKLSIDNIFLDTISKKIINDYYSMVGIYISLVEFTQIVKDSIQTIFNKGSEIYDEVLLFKDDFINNIKIYNTESSNKIESLNQEKYTNNNIYIEKYYYLSEQNFNLINDASFATSFAVLLSKSYIGAVSPVSMLSLLNNLINLNQNVSNNIFNILPKFEYGVRLMYNPVINFQNKKRKYDIISSKEIPSKEKINAMVYDNERNSEYYFPIKLSEVKYNLYSILGEKNIQNLYQLVNNFDGVFNLAAKSLWTEENFKNLFMYHIPLQVIYPIMFKNISDKYKLLKQVFDENLPYNNLNETIINLIDRIENAEDPNTL